MRTLHPHPRSHRGARSYASGSSVDGARARGRPPAATALAGDAVGDAAGPRPTARRAPRDTAPVVFSMEYSRNAMPMMWPTSRAVAHT